MPGRFVRLILAGHSPCRLLEPHRRRRPAAGDQLAVPAQDGGRGDQQPEAPRLGEESGERGDEGAIGPRRPRAWRASLEHGELGGAGPGSRCPCSCRIGCTGRSSPGAWRTSGRSAAAPPADHAWHLARANEQVTGSEHSFGHLHPAAALVAPGERIMSCAASVDLEIAVDGRDSSDAAVYAECRAWRQRTSPAPSPACCPYMEN